MKKCSTEEKACDICGGTNVQELNRSKDDGNSVVLKDGNDLVQNVDVMCMDC